MKRLTLVAVCLLGVASSGIRADSLYENTNLALFEIPDVLADGIKPYDDRLWETGERVNGKRCCERKMYRIDDKKIVLLSHNGDYFLVIVITDGASKMYFAEEPGIFVEQPVEKGGTWSVPDWLKAKS